MTATPVRTASSGNLLNVLERCYFFLAVGAGPFPAFAAAHRAFIAAANFAFTSGDILRRFFAGASALAAAGAVEAAGAFVALILAQRAFWAATMRARPAADILPFFFFTGVGAAFATGEAAWFPRMLASSFSSAAICSAIARPRCHWARVGMFMDWRNSISLGYGKHR